MDLFDRAEAGPLDEFRRARALHLRGHASFAMSGASDVSALQQLAGERLMPLDIHYAREAYLDALTARLLKGAPRVRLREVAEAALGAVRADPPPRGDGLLLEGMTHQVLEGFAAAVPSYRRALDAFASTDVSDLDASLTRGWVACSVAASLWEDELHRTLVTRVVRLARESGWIVSLPLTLAHLALLEIRHGELASMAATLDQLNTVSEALGGFPAPRIALAAEAHLGREAEFLRMHEHHSEERPTSGNDRLFSAWASALLYNGLGRHAEAFSAAETAFAEPQPLDSSSSLLPELIEAAALSSRFDVGTVAMQRLSEMTRASGTDWALGLEARSRALMSDDVSAEPHYREAIERLASPGTRIEHARAHLVYGEWLQRIGRTGEARQMLRHAHEEFLAMGLEGFAGRAARTLRTTGVAVINYRIETGDGLTDRESQIARLAARGTVQFRHRRPPLPEPADDRIPPAQGLREARDRLTQAAGGGAGATGSRR